MPKELVHELRVRYAECDPQGIVFNSRYLEYFDVALTELWREALGSYDEPMAAEGVDLVVAEAGLRFRSSLRFDDVFEIVATLSRLGTTSITTAFELRRAGEPVAEGELRHVFVDRDTGAKTEVPSRIRESLAPYLAAGRHSSGVADSSSETPRSRVYVTGHRNPDLDSIASAIGYAELKARQDPSSDYVAVRLGSVNAQSAWALDRSGANKPELMEHVMLRVRDVMRERFPVARYEEPLREVGRTMARDDLDIVPIVGDDGELIGVMTERALARRYIRESRKVSSLVDAPTTIRAIVDVLDADLIEGGEGTVEGRVWVHSIDASRSDSRISEGDVVVVGNRADAQRQSLELGAALLITSNDVPPEPEILELARERGASVAVSPLDSYVSSRMVTLAAPSGAMADREPLTVTLDDLVADISEEIKDVHYRAAVAVDGEGRPVGLITRSDLVAPSPRRVILVDHAEAAQSVIGVEQAEIVEILDHHHIGSIETRVPVTATFDPVGSTATLVVERFRTNGFEPSRSTAALLLCAVLSDTVLLRSPTTTERDAAVIAYLESLLDLDAQEFGREMFESTSDVSHLSAGEIATHDAKEYALPSGETVSIAQIETVGRRVLERRAELLEAIGQVRERNGHAIAALMVTDILEQSTDLLSCGETAALERAFGERDGDGVIHLPGVMSRKKQVAPVLMSAA